MKKIGADFYNFIKANSFFNLTLIEKNIRDQQEKIIQIFLKSFCMVLNLNLMNLININLRKKT